MKSRTSLLPAAILALAVTAARLLYIARICPYDLVEDEAHYWEWSRRLDWSYYSKGPGVAWAIRAATSIFGTSEFSVRLPAVLAGGVLMLAAAALARDCVARCGPIIGSPKRITPRRAALFAAAAALVAPVFQLPGILMTIDGPYLACWMLACWAAWRAFMHGSRSAWPLLGAAVAIGFLFKYTILLLIPGLVLFALLRRKSLTLAPGWKAWSLTGLLAAAAGLVPVAVWNAQRGWPTVKHLLGHLGVSGGDVAVSPPGEGSGWNPLWTLEFIGSQIAMVGPLLVLAFIAWRRGRASLHASFLVCAAAPLLAFYLLVSFITEPEQNWAIASFCTLLVLAGIFGAGLWDAAAIPNWRPATRLARALWVGGMIYGAVAAVGMHRIDWVVGLRNAIILSPPVKSLLESRGRTPQAITPGRLIGAKQMGAAIGARMVHLRKETGVEPILIAEHYGRASQMAFYLPDRPTTYCGSALFGGRRTQYDLWPITSFADPKTAKSLQGRAAIILTNDKDWKREQWGSLFERIEPLGRLPGEHKKDRIAYAGYGFKADAAAKQAGGGTK